MPTFLQCLFGQTTWLYLVFKVTLQRHESLGGFLRNCEIQIMRLTEEMKMKFWIIMNNRGDSDFWWWARQIRMLRHDETGPNNLLEETGNQFQGYYIEHVIGWSLSGKCFFRRFMLKRSVINDCFSMIPWCEPADLAGRERTCNSFFCPWLGSPTLTPRTQWKPYPVVLFHSGMSRGSLGLQPYSWWTPSASYLLSLTWFTQVSHPRLWQLLCQPFELFSKRCSLL